MKAVEIVQHDHIERRGGRSILLVAAHMQLVVIGPAIGETVDQPRITVEGEDDWLVPGEEPIEVGVGKTVWMLARWLQSHQIHDVDDADLEIRKVLAQDLHRGQCFERRYITTARHHHIGGTVLIVARPFPYAKSR